MLNKLIFLTFILLCSAKDEPEHVIEADENGFRALHGPRIGPSYPTPPPVYEINLDLSYEDRWRKVMTEIGGPNIPTLFNWFIAKATIPDEIVQSMNYTILEAYDKEFAMEMQAISKILDFPFQKVVLLNTFFDATTMCTGMIIQDKDNNIYHGRNLDFIEAPTMSRMVFQGNYMKDGKLLYQAITKVGQVGLLTGIKKGAYTINMNQNMDPTAGADVYWDTVKKNIKGIYGEMTNHWVSQQNRKASHLKEVTVPLKYSPILAARRAIENCDSYEEIIDYLTDVPTFSRAFYIIAGTQPGQGTVITKKGNNIEYVKKLDAENGVWYLLQSNYAHNYTDPVYDNRFTAGVAQIDAIGREQMTKDRLFSEVLHAYPIFNNGTIHTTVMQASTDLFNTTVWRWEPVNGEASLTTTTAAAATEVETE